jgi:hypothetical protein
MPSNADPLGNVELMAAGENLNTWGDPKLNTALTLIIQMIAGRSSYAVSGAYAPTSTNYVANEYRRFIHEVTGTGGTITMPGKSFVKLFRNGGTGPITVTTGSGVTATVAAGASALVWCDGTNVRRLFDNDAGGAKLINLGAPTASTDAATRGYVDATAFMMAAGSLPGQSGSAKRALVTDGTAASWDWAYNPPRDELATDATLAEDSYYDVDTSITRALTLPALSGMTLGGVVEVRDATGQAGTNNISVVPGGADAFLGGLTSPFLINLNRGGALFVARATGWRVLPV